MISGKDLEGWINAPDPQAAMEKDQNRAYYRDRRDRIATACMAGLLAADFDRSFAEHAKDAVDYADALIAELDKPKKVKKVKKVQP